MWVVNYWRQATTNIMDPLPPQCNGWKQTEAGLEVEWDSEDNIKQVKHCIDFLLHANHLCQMKLCKCVKNNQFCGPGCESNGCINNQSSQGKTYRIYTTYSQIALIYGNLVLGLCLKTTVSLLHKSKATEVRITKIYRTD